MQSPRGKEEKRLKSLIIKMMKRYYSFSRVAVALDGELMRLSMKDCDKSELLLRVALYGWMRRCWCFIEAINSGGFIQICFKDGLFDLTRHIVSRAFRANDNWFFLMSASQRRWKVANTSVQLLASALLVTYIALAITWDLTIQNYDVAKLLEIWLVCNFVGRHQLVPNFR